MNSFINHTQSTLSARFLPYPITRTSGSTAAYELINHAQSTQETDALSRPVGSEPLYYRDNRTAETNFASQPVDPVALSHQIPGTNATGENLYCISTHEFRIAAATRGHVPGNGYDKNY